MMEAMCKGDWSLGTACGKCSRCFETFKPFVARLASENQTMTISLATAISERDAAIKDAASWKREFEMYARAWQRELGPYGIYNKTHLIDALVKTTREIVSKYEEWKRETASMKERRRQEEIAATIGWAAQLPIDMEKV